MTKTVTVQIEIITKAAPMAVVSDLALALPEGATIVGFNSYDETPTVSGVLGTPTPDADAVTKSDVDEESAEAIAERVKAEKKKVAAEKAAVTRAAKKAAKEKADAEAAATTEGDDSDLFGEEKVEEKVEALPAKTADDLRAAVRVHAQKHGTDATRALLSTNGYARATDVPADKIAEFIQVMEK